MFRYVIFSVTFLWSVVALATSSTFPPPGMTLPEYWGEK
ncbi:fimbrial protein, partial [Escherichia coli]